MKKNKIILTSILFLFIVSCGKQYYSNRGNKSYEELAYIKAIDYYLKAVDKGDNSIITARRLAKSYNKISDFENSEKWFSKVIKYSNSDLDDIYNFAQSLKGIKEYDSYNKFMNLYTSKNKTAVVSKEFLEKKDLVDSILVNQDLGFKVKNLDVNTQYSDFAPIFYKDKINFVSARNPKVSIKNNYSWNNKPFLDIYEGDFYTNNQINNVKKLKGSINTKFHEGPMAYTKDFKTVYFTRNNYNKNKKRNSKLKINKLALYKGDVDDDKIINIEPLSFNDKEYSVGHPTLSPDDKWLYFSSDMPGGVGGVDLYKIEIKENGFYGNPINLGEGINTEGDEMFPFFDANGALFFSSNGHVGIGGLDIIAQFFDENGKPTYRKNLGIPINSSKDDFSFVLNKDKKRGYFASNRDGGKGDDDIYSFEVLKPIYGGLFATGIVSDKFTNEPLSDINIYLESSKTSKIIDSIKTNNKGEYALKVNRGYSYKLIAKSPKYFPNDKEFNTNNLDINVNKVKHDIILEKDPNMHLFLKVKDKNSNERLDSVSLVITDNYTNEKMEYIINSDEPFNKKILGKKINDRGSYNVELRKSGYTPKSFTYNVLFDKEGSYDIGGGKHLLLEKIKLGDDLTKTINLKPIYFDLNKYDIRPDAALELDKIVKIMNENPSMEIELGSHTDSRGRNSSNLILSDRRAKSSANYIISRGVSSSRILGKGYGESRIINKCKDGVRCSENEHQLNRRTEFIIKKL